jgi:tight adherence protein C
MVAGSVALSRGVHDHAVDRGIKRRFYAEMLLQHEAVGVTGLVMKFFEWLGRKATGLGSVSGIRIRLQRAGFSSSVGPYVFVGMRLFATTTAVLAALLLPWLGNGFVGNMDAAIAVFSGVSVYRSFEIGLRWRIGGREREIRRELPYVLDLVLMVLDSGVSIDQALRHVAGQIDQTSPVTAAQLKIYLSEIDEGLPYDQALDRLAQRLGISEGRDFAGLLKLNLFQGGELGPPLRRLAADIGEVRLAMAREQVGRKSVLLTMVMLVFFMPVLMVALAGPAVSDVIETLGHVAHDLQNSRKR